MVEPTSSISLSGPSITHHLITLPHPQYTYFLTQLVHLSTAHSHSLFLHCTHIPSSTAHSLLPNSASDDSETDAELVAALAAANRISNPSNGPISSLTGDFALALCPPPSSSVNSEYKRQPQSTTIASSSASTTSLAASMARRIAFKLSIPQLILSLDLPPALAMSASNQTQILSPQDSAALLALEKALRDTCAFTLSSS